MMRRLPLLLTLVPLALALGIYWLFWTGWAAQFQAVVDEWLPPGSARVGGFPYRLEAEAAAPRLAGGEVVRLVATATRARINRGPWRPELTVVTTEAPQFSAIVGPVIRAAVTARTAITSINVDPQSGRLLRLSTAADRASVTTGVLPVAITADRLEVHLRERKPGTAAAGASTGPPRGQLVLSGTAVRLGQGAPLSLAADLVATGPARLTAYDRWAASGTIEITGLTLGDATGEVARVAATLVPIGRTGLRLAGTIATVCPASVAAAIAAAPPVSEQRLRTPVRLAFEGSAGAIRLAPLPADLARRAVRAQLPPCPVLRR